MPPARSAGMIGQGYRRGRASDREQGRAHGLSQRRGKGLWRCCRGAWRAWRPRSQWMYTRGDSIDTRYLARLHAESLAMSGEIGGEPGHYACHSRPPVPVGAFTLGTTGAALTLKLTITASGFSGTITTVSVQLVSLSTPFVNDVDVLLIHPNGSNNLVFWSDSTTDATGNLNGAFTFSDSATTCPPTKRILPSLQAPTLQARRLRSR